MFFLKKKKKSDPPILTALIKFLHAYCNAEIQNESKYSKRSTCHKISRIQKIKKKIKKLRGYYPKKKKLKIYIKRPLASK
jgi:seryl-tRNA(Sec) selenium transferase